MKTLKTIFALAIVLTMSLTSCDGNMNEVGKSYCERELQIKKDNGWAPQDCQCQYDAADDNWFFDCN